MVRWVRRGITSQVVPEAVGEGPEEAGVAGLGSSGRGRGLRAVLEVEFRTVGEADKAVCDPYADQVARIAGQGGLWQP